MRRLLLVLLAIPAVAWGTMTGETVHFFDLIDQYTLDGRPNSPIICSPPGTEVYVTSDDGITSTVSITKSVSLKKMGAGYPLPSWCAGYVVAGQLYQLPDSALNHQRYSAKSWVSGVLVLPFKYHPGNHALTPGGTIGAYVGYQNVAFDTFTITPVLSAGLTIVNTTPIGATAPATATGLSVASGLIGSVGNSPLQFGFLVGMDWLEKSAHYDYSGKPYLSVEIGYSFGQ